MLASISPKQMPMTVQQLISDESSWQIHASAATRSAALQLADLEVENNLRRVLSRISEEG